MKTGNLLIQSLWKNIYLTPSILASGSLLPELHLGKRLICEGSRHDERWVTGGATQVEKTSLRKDNYTAPRLKDKLVHLGLDVGALGNLHKSVHVNFVVKVTNVSNNGVVLHLGHGVSHENSLVSGGGDEDVGKANYLLKSGDGVPLHASLKSADGVDLSHVHNTAVGAHGSSASLANISVSADDGLLSRHHDVGGAHDTVGEGVLAPVQVVEFGLGHGVVDVDGGEEEGAGLLHGVKTVDSGGGLLGHSHAASGDLVPLIGLAGLQETLDDAEHNLELGVVGGVGVGESSVLEELVLGLLSLVDEEGHVSAVVHDDVHAVALAIVLGPGDGVESALPVFLEGFSLPCEDGGALVLSNGGGGVVLGGEDVARAPADVSSEGFEGFDEDGGLDGHVEGSGDAGSFQGLVFHFFSARHEARHLYLGHFDFFAAIVREGNVSDFVISGRHGC
mmetsp:Transcript_6425/g.8428  ORF Transcript_6425/g.8428 Transcript_6425/m.8428 type:complete len:449 (-) Transcript_6425:20-1366(-)